MTKGKNLYGEKKKGEKEMMLLASNSKGEEVIKTVQKAQIGKKKRRA